MVANAATRSSFVRNSIEFLKKNGFDGLDLDWEYPSANDKQLFTSLVQVSNFKI